MLYEGRMRGNVDSVPTEVKLTVPADPKVLKLEEVVVFAFELSALEAHRLPPGEPCERCMCNFMTYWHRLPTAACPGRVADPGKLRTQPVSTMRMPTQSPTRSSEWPPTAFMIRTWR